MSIRIRVYPQEHSIGARRNRAAKRQMAAQQRQLNLANFRLQRQLGATVPGGNPYGPASRMPLASPYGAFGSYGFPQQGYGSYGSAYGSPFGASQFGVSQFGASQFGMPQFGLGTAQYGGYGYGTPYSGASYSPYASLNSVTQMGPFGTQQAYQAAANYGFGWA